MLYYKPECLKEDSIIMKIIIVLLISVSIACTQTINEQIKSLEQLTPKERVVLMNHIKEQLIEMNQNERMNTIEKLRAKMNPSQKQVPHDKNLQLNHGGSKNAEHNKHEPKNLDNDVKEREHQGEPIKERIENAQVTFERLRGDNKRVRGAKKPPPLHHRDIKDR